MKRLTSVGLLVLPLLIAGVAHTAAAQMSTFDPKAPLESLRSAPASADSQLVRLATGLLEARVDRKISFDTYLEGVKYFQQHHPQFYGAFFGDPFYARYNVRYEKLAHERQVANLEVNPQSSYWSRQWLLCHPLGYDPAWGRCWGLAYAASDFFRLPFALRNPLGYGASPLPGSWKLGTIQRENFPDREERSDVPRPPEESPLPEDSSSFEAPPIQVDSLTTTGYLTRRIRTPDDLNAKLQSKASSFRRIEEKLLIRQLVRKQYGEGDLTPQERLKIAKTLAEKFPATKLVATETGDQARSGTTLPENYRELMERRWNRTMNRTERGGVRTYDTGPEGVARPTESQGTNVRKTNRPRNQESGSEGPSNPPGSSNSRSTGGSEKGSGSEGPTSSGG